MAGEADYRLRPCPAELSELIPADICPEVRQIVLEAFQKHRAITDEAVQERSIQLGAVEAGLPHEFRQTQSLANLAREAVLPVQTPTDSRRIRQSSGQARQPINASESLPMPGAFPSEPSDEGEPSDPPPSYTDVVEPNMPLIDAQNHLSTESARMRHGSNLSQSSASQSSYFSVADSASSRTSVEIQGNPQSASPQGSSESTKRAGPKSWLKSTIARKSQTEIKEVDECLACATEFPIKELVTLTCPEKHKYCSPCFEQLVKSRCESESVFPPQCCQVEIPASLINSKISRGTRKLYEAQEKIASIAPDQRWYCPYRRCLKVFNVRIVEISKQGAKCPHCRRLICVSCKQAAHIRTAECSDGALKATLLASKDNGWQSCFKCGEMVELKEGCRHVTCRCKAEFCYVCSRRWPTCVNNHECSRKLDQARERQAREKLTREIQARANPARETINSAAEPRVQKQALVQERLTRRPAIRRRTGSGRSLAENGRLLAERAAPSANMTEEQQIAYAMRQSLLDAEDAETMRALEESQRIAFTVAAIGLHEEREWEESVTREQQRLARLEYQFRSYETQLEQIRTFQEAHIVHKYVGNPLQRPGAQITDLQWLERMHLERWTILEVDHALLIENPDFDLHQYRQAARQQQAGEEDNTSAYALMASHLAMTAARNRETTQAGGGSIMSRPRPPRLGRAPGAIAS